MLDPLYWLVSAVMVAIHRALSPVFGETSGVTWSLSIVGLVVLIRVLLIPLFVRQIKSQRALTALSPEMKKTSPSPRKSQYSSANYQATTNALPTAKTPSATQTPETTSQYLRFTERQLGSLPLP